MGSPLCSGIGLAARHVGDKHVATAQVANTGLVSLAYIQKISEKVGLGHGIIVPDGGNPPPFSMKQACEVWFCDGLLQVSLASDFMWNLNSREANASFGYDYVLRQCRLRGRIDTGAPGGWSCGVAHRRMHAC